jgi:hypothetical protein
VIDASVWFSLWIGTPSFGLDRLVQAVAPAPADHEAPVNSSTMITSGLPSSPFCTT